MFHYKCILTLPDGRQASAEIDCISDGAEYPINLTDPHGILPPIPGGTADAGYLRCWCNNLAKKTGGKLDIEHSGEYEYWSGDQSEPT
jgi:hypothetical protein